MANNKNLPDIKGTETIANTWHRLLDRDRNSSNLFSGDAFTADQKGPEDYGRPNWRIDLNRLFIFTDKGFVNLFDFLTPQEISYTNDSKYIPDNITDVKTALDFLINRNMLNTVTMPADSIQYIGDNSTTTYNLNRFTGNKNTIQIFIDGVKQATDTFSLTPDGLGVILKQAPVRGENIEIVQLNSLLEYDYAPIVKTFTGDGKIDTFDFGIPVLNVNSVSVNIDGKELQKKDFIILPDGRNIKTTSLPSSGASIQITTVGKTSLVTVSPNSIGTQELKDHSVTVDKLVDKLPVDITMIPSGGITGAKIANGSIDSSKLSTNSVTSEKITNGSVTQEKLAQSVKNGLLTNGKVSGAYLASKAVSRDKLADDLSQLLANIESRLALLEKSK